MSGDNVIAMPTPLGALAQRIRDGHGRATRGDYEWAEGILVIAAAMFEARKQFDEDDRRFGHWIIDNKLNFHNNKDRTALVRIGEHADIAKQILHETKRRSLQHIWNVEIRPRISAHVSGDRKVIRMSDHIAATTAPERKPPKPAKKKKAALPPLPNGHTLMTDTVRAGIALERDGRPAVEAYASSGLSRNGYIVARDVVLLSERSDLGDGDAAIARKAFALLNDQRQVSPVREMIKPLVAKVWGRKGHRFKSDKNRSSQFCDSVSFVVSTCHAVTGSDIPVLDQERRKELQKGLKEAIEALRNLRRKLS